MTVQSRGFLASRIKEQGERTVGDDTVPLVTSPTPCSRVWIGAPTANHNVGELNTGPILIGQDDTGNTEGGMPLESDNPEGFTFLVSDAQHLQLTGLNAGDVVEYQVYE